MQIANRGGFSKAIGLARGGGEDGVVIAVQKYSEKSREAYDDIQGGKVVVE